ncbi:META and DUF4377 domain-containing protein [Bordetella sp. BOR01]|uniref:META and DUF4377 domain-containing protein n=1 Tax=Bordetella sp. BOR01 TaxID=2854779 RepID=UPI001C44C4B9|nr:META and DUF4377 domain-containing protein [Bordetella sp. BOR01]MBV7482933.1 META and DUF4377 domain-containing protein [Bordetella sp. BOR01]
MKLLAFRFLLIGALSVLAACAMNDKRAPSAGTSATPATAAPDLSAYHWDLTHARDAGGAAQTRWVPPTTRNGAPLRLSFADNRLSVSGLCNRLGASYAIQGDRLKISQVVGTMMACSEPGLMQYEQAFSQRLPQAASWHIDQGQDGPTLTLGFADGAQWTLAGTPTDQTRFGSAGQTIFLEVAAQRVACSHPLIPDTQCLQVREIQYDANGLKTGHGDWQAFYSDIEGYTHEPGVRNVLRIKRYERQQVPADASRYAYVLDMVVESAQEGR